MRLLGHAETDRDIGEKPRMLFGDTDPVQIGAGVEDQFIDPGPESLSGENLRVGASIVISGHRHDVNPRVHLDPIERNLQPNRRTPSCGVQYMRCKITGQSRLACRFDPIPV